MAKTENQLQIGEAMFDMATGEISAGREVTKLRPQTTRFLTYLMDHAGAVASKADLLDHDWPDTHVTEDSLVQCASEIRKALRGVTGVELSTIPKNSYRLNVTEPSTSKTGYSGSRRMALWGLAVMTGLAISIGSLWFRSADTPGEQVTVAVLPFQSMSGDPTQTYFSNGLAEDLITDLSGLSDVRAISRSASFSLNPATSSFQEIAELLRANAIVEGSVRQAGDTLRVSVALVDGDDGSNLWARRFEGTPDDIFSFQDEVTQEIVRTLSVRLSDAERTRLGVRGTINVAAHDAYLRGREFENLYTRETNLEAEAALKEAIRIDPDYALPHAHLSQVYSFRVENNWTRDREGDIRAAFYHAERALELDAKLPFARLCRILCVTRFLMPLVSGLRT